MSPAWPKPVPRATVKRRRQRITTAVIRSVRRDVATRDGYCRVLDAGIPWAGWCSGPSEWAHLSPYKRFQTQGQLPARRHHVQGSLMLCRRHHRAYDSGTLDITGSDVGAEGPLVFRCGDQIYEEYRRQ